MSFRRLPQREGLANQHLKFALLHQVEAGLGPLLHQAMLRGSGKQYEAADFYRFGKESIHVEFIRRASCPTVKNYMAERRGTFEYPKSGWRGSRCHGEEFRAGSGLPNAQRCMFNVALRD